MFINRNKQQTKVIKSSRLLVSPECFAGRMQAAGCMFVTSALLGRFCYASNFVHTPHIALSSQQGELSEGVSVYACCACVQQFCSHCLEVIRIELKKEQS